MMPSIAARSPHHSRRRGTRRVQGDLNLDISSSLSEAEAAIFDLLLSAVKRSKCQTVVRVAGGWVRDKLLGLQNEDIDIALDNCSGVAFSDVVNAYLISSGQDEGKVAVIEPNPDQSKHLETARMKIMGIWIDFVNLRTETYRSDNRIPEASFGTAEEDALRRDFTLNALFYNVNTRTVEDMTGRGVDDLRDGILRTPLPAITTFDDDPLRILRAVRFASRFDFTLDEELCKAAMDGKVQAALGSKVSRERVGAELSGMISGKMAQPALALTLLHELRVARVVFALPDNIEPKVLSGSVDWARGAAVARAAARLLEHRTFSQTGQVGLGEISVDGEAGAKLASTTLPRVPGERETTREVDSAAAGEHLIPDKAGIVTEGAHDVAARPRKDGENSDEASGTLARSNAPQNAEPGTLLSRSRAVPVESMSMGKGNEKEQMEMAQDRRGTETGTEAGTRAPGKESNGGCTTSNEPEPLIRELFLGAALIPLEGVKHKFKKGKWVPAAQSVVQESLKLKAKEAKNVGEILEMLPVFRRLLESFQTGGSGTVTEQTCAEAKERDEAPSKLSRLELGLAIRQVKELWKTCVCLCCAEEMYGLVGSSRETQNQERMESATPFKGEDHGENYAATGGDGDGDGGPGGKRVRIQRETSDQTENDEHNPQQEERVMAKYTAFISAVRGMGLARAWTLAPLLGGNDIMRSLGVPKGPGVGKMMSKQVEWQLEHPSGTREECIAYLAAELGNI